MELILKNVQKTYQNIRVLDDLSIDLNGKNAIAIIGPSGAGKSTLLRLLSKIEEPDAGSIRVNNHLLQEIAPEEYFKTIGFVFQSHTLFPHLSVMKNITLVLEKVHGKSKTEARDIALRLLRKFDLEDQAGKPPHKLSGGQSQRVSIVRMTWRSIPKSCFWTSQTSALDPVLKQEVLRTVLKLREERTSFVIVTHELLFAKKAADYLIFMKDGKIVEHGDIAILAHPQTEELKEFLRGEFIDCTDK
ncbi:MAG: ATP-binding cassette domain-containing protein [Bacillus subtilis]|nr:ATP-binding cassette domain-containing protein [Bacillus subtilis]